MKKMSALLLSFVLLLTACGGGASSEDSGSNSSDGTPTWQEQYDLGVRYLSEGNYEEAIIAFTAAIEIDAKKPEAYTGRGQAYVLSGETEENLTAALADFEAALDLDETQVDAWLGLADVYIRQGDYDKALEVLREALEKTENDPSIADKIAEMESGSYVDSMGNVRRSESYTTDGTLIGYSEYHYDELGRRSSWENYDYFDDEGNIISTPRMYNRCEVTFDAKGRPEKYQFYGTDGALENYDTFVYNEADQITEQHRYDADGNDGVYFLFYYDAQGREERYESYNPDGTMYSYTINEYDADGNLVRETTYNPDGTPNDYTTFQ